jgi:hypothetical protein
MNNELKTPFGKHKGTPVKDLPGEYLRWLSTIELREPLRSAVAAALARLAVPVQKKLGVATSTPPVRTAQEGAFAASQGHSKPVPRGSQHREVARPKRAWRRPEDEDLSQYYSQGSNDGIGF